MLFSGHIRVGQTPVGFDHVLLRYNQNVPELQSLL